VYATCSLLEEENESIVTNFLSTHTDYELRPMSEVMAEQKIPLIMDDYLKLLPHLHHTDGFFAAVIERKA
jgi:16S rRNA (cytosine967-C5)-methyltransferase